MPDDYMTGTEVAALFGVTPKTIRHWVEQGILKPMYLPLTQYRRYRTAEVEKLYDWYQSGKKAEEAG